VGCGDLDAADEADVGPAEIIGNHEQDVWPLGQGDTAPHPHNSHLENKYLENQSRQSHGHGGIGCSQLGEPSATAGRGHNWRCTISRAPPSP
jgi:hypothetical protein